MSWLSGLVHRAWDFGVDWTRNNWKMLASLAVSAIVFTAVVALMPVSVPVLATMAVAGFASGAVGAIVSDLLDRHPVTVKHVLIAGVISGVLAMASFGIAKFVGPRLPELWKPIEKPLTTWVVKPVASIVGRPVVTAVTNGVVAVTEPLIASATRAAEVSVGQVGASIAREIRTVNAAANQLPPRPPAPPPPRLEPGDGLPLDLANFAPPVTTTSDTTATTLPAAPRKAPALGAKSDDAIGIVGALPGAR